MNSLSETIDVRTHGVYPNASADQSSLLHTAFTAAAGQALFMPPGDYKSESALTLPDDTVLLARDARIYNTGAAATMIHLNSGCQVFGLELEGTGNASYVDAGRGFSIIGTVSSYKSNILLEDCYVHDFSGYGVFSEFPEHVKINRGRYFDIGHAGIQAKSPRHWNIYRTHIKGVTPGDAVGNAYGITFTRQSSTDTVNFPKPKDCAAERNLIEDVDIWEGLDTHSGEDCKFINNVVLNCKVGIAAVSTGVGSDEYAAPMRTLIQGNTIIGNGTGSGIQVAGAKVFGQVGTWNELAEGNIVANNILEDCGQAENSNNGAIYVVTTRRTVVSGNTVKRPRPHGILFYFDNYGFVIDGNSVEDPFDNVVTVPGGIVMRAENNQGIVSGNTLERLNAALGTYVAVRGIYVVSNATTFLTIGPNRNTFTTPIYGATGAKYHYGTLASGVHIYSGNGSPEGVITAPVGSLYLRLDGGSGTTLYVKQVGSDEYGWSGK